MQSEAPAVPFEHARVQATIAVEDFEPFPLQRIPLPRLQLAGAAEVLGQMRRQGQMLVAGPELQRRAFAGAEEIVQAQPREARQAVLGDVMRAQFQGGQHALDDVEGHVGRVGIFGHPMDLHPCVVDDGLPRQGLGLRPDLLQLDSILGKDAQTTAQRPRAHAVIAHHVQGANALRARAHGIHGPTLLAEALAHLAQLRHVLARLLAADVDDLLVGPETERREFEEIQPQQQLSLGGDDVILRALAQMRDAPRHAHEAVGRAFARKEDVAHVDDDAVRKAEIARHLDGDVVDQSTVHQGVAVHLHRHEHEGQAAARADVAGQCAVIADHGRGVDDVGGHAAEGNGQPVEVRIRLEERVGRQPSHQRLHGLAIARAGGRPGGPIAQLQLELMMIQARPVALDAARRAARVQEQRHPLLRDHHLPQLGGRDAGGIERPEDGAHAGPDDEIRDQALLLQHLEHADVGQAARAAAAQDQRKPGGVVHAGLGLDLGIVLVGTLTQMVALCGGLAGDQAGREQKRCQTVRQSSQSQRGTVRLSPPPRGN